MGSIILFYSQSKDWRKQQTTNSITMKLPLLALVLWTSNCSADGEPLFAPNHGGGVVNNTEGNFGEEIAEGIDKVRCLSFDCAGALNILCINYIALTLYY